MCIAIIIPRGATPPPLPLLAKCFRRNPHGAGFAWATQGVTHYRKGYKTFASFLHAYKSHMPAVCDGHMIHFRLASAGGPGPEFTHPFPISASMVDLYSLAGESTLGVLMHNGTIPGLGVPGGMSDSQVLARRIAQGKLLDPLEMGNSRIAMLLPSGEALRMGSWVPKNFGAPEQPQCLFSNYGFEMPEETTWYRISRWYRGLTADAKAMAVPHPVTVDKGLMYVNLKGVHEPVQNLFWFGGVYVDPDRRVYMVASKRGSDGALVRDSVHRVGMLANYRRVPPLQPPPATVSNTAQHTARLPV